MIKLTTIVLIIALLPLQAAASALPDLPSYSVPVPSAMEVPELSQDYGDMLDGLAEEGWGKKNFDPDKPLPIPEVEAPEGTGRTAVDNFHDHFGDMWNDRQFEDISIMPDDDFFDSHTRDFQQENDAILNSIRSENHAEMAVLLDRRLDAEDLMWDFDAAREGISFMNDEEISSLLSNARRPGGFSDIRGAASQVPDRNSWLGSINSPSGYGTESGNMMTDLINRASSDVVDALNNVMPGNIVRSTVDGIDEIATGIGNVADTIFNPDDDLEALKDEAQAYRDAGEEVPQHLKDDLSDATRQRRVDRTEALFPDTEEAVGRMTEGFQKDTGEVVQRDIEAARNMQEHYGGDVQYVGRFNLPFMDERVIYSDKDSWTGRAFNRIRGGEQHPVHVTNNQDGVQAWTYEEDENGDLRAVPLNERDEEERDVPGAYLDR